MGLFGGNDTARLEARIARLERTLATVMKALNLEVDSNPAADAIRDAIAEGRKIEAIKLYREASGVGLAEAKDAIERGTWEMDLRTGSLR